MFSKELRREGGGDFVLLGVVLVVVVLTLDANGEYVSHMLGFMTGHSVI